MDSKREVKTGWMDKRKGYGWMDRNKRRKDGWIVDGKKLDGWTVDGWTERKKAGWMDNERRHGRKRCVNSGQHMRSWADKNKW